MSTEKRYADLMRQALTEAVEIKEGRRKPAHVSRHPITARQVKATPPAPVTPGRAREIRTRMQMSQAVFAGVLGVSPETVRAWEQGKRTPGGPALRLLEVAERSPAALIG